MNSYSISIQMMMLLLTSATSSCSGDVDLGFIQLGIFKVLFLGIVQGITELLPISSTAHMKIVPSLLGWPDPGTAFSAAMQLASVFAVITYFWKEIQQLSHGTVQAITKMDYRSKPLRIVLGLFLGTIPLVFFGLLFKSSLNACNSPFRRIEVIATASIVMSALLALAELNGKRQRDFSKIKLIDGIWVGCAQVLALIPGVSRSGSTLTAGLFLGMERETAAMFSFLLGLPAVILAGLLEINTLLHAGLDSQGWVVLIVGLVSASVSAFLAIFGLLRYLERQSTWIFVWYRFLMGVFLWIGAVQGFLK